MNIFHINGNYIWSSLHQLMIRNLELVGITNSVFVPTYCKDRSVIIPDCNVVVDECFKKSDRFLFFKKQKKIIEAIENKGDISSCDLIHAYTLFTDGNAAMVLSEKHGIPYVVAVRNTDINSFFKYRIFLRSRGLKILKKASAIFFLSETYKERTINKYVPKTYRKAITEKSYIIPNGIDDYWLDNIFYDRDLESIENRIERHGVNLIYAGTIDNNKNIGLTAEAVKQLNDSGWKVKFTVVGKVKNKKIVDGLIGRSDIHFVEQSPKESLIKLYRNSDIFIMPSHFETFGLVYAEAMSQGLPVIYTRGQGFDKQFEEGIVGLSCDDYDIAELVAKIKQICLCYSTMSRNCTSLVEKFRWSSIAYQYQSVYSTII